MQDVGQLVAALPAGDVHDHVRIAPLRDLLEHHGLAGAEAARHRSRAAMRDRVEQVEHALPGDQLHVGLEPLAVRPRRAHGPALQERDLRPVDAGDRLLDRVRARGRDPIERPFHSGRHEHPVLDGRRLRNRAEQATGGDGATGCGGGRELPAPVSRQRLTHGAAGEEIRRGCERAQHAVEDAAEQAGPQLRRERQPTAPDGLSGSQPARVLVDLDGRAVAIHRDDLARQASLADRDDLEHAGSVHPRRLHHRAVDAEHAAGHAHSDSTSVPSSSSRRSTSAGSVESIIRCPSRAITPPTSAGSRSIVASGPRRSRAPASSRSSNAA